MFMENKSAENIRLRRSRAEIYSHLFNKLLMPLASAKINQVSHSFY